MFSARCHKAVTKQHKSRMSRRIVHKKQTYITPYSFSTNNIKIRVFRVYPGLFFLTAFGDGIFMASFCHSFLEQRLVSQVVSLGKFQPLRNQQLILMFLGVKTGKISVIFQSKAMVVGN